MADPARHQGDEGRGQRHDPGGGITRGPGGFAAASAPVEGSDRTLAAVAHLTGIVPVVIGPLLVRAAAGRRDSRFVHDQATEALNFQLTVVAALLVSLLLSVVLIGPVLFVLVLLAAIVLSIVGAVRAASGSVWRYPAAFKLVR